jgi:hypothetical protein
VGAQRDRHPTGTAGSSGRGRARTVRGSPGQASPRSVSFVDDEIDRALMVYAAEVGTFDVAALLEDPSNSLWAPRLRAGQSTGSTARGSARATHRSRSPGGDAAVAIGEHLGLDPDRLAGKPQASIHDVGKIAVPRPHRPAWPGGDGAGAAHSVVGWGDVNRFGVRRCAPAPGE